MRPRPGFTLLELLVALTITVLVVGATYGALSTALDAAERNRAIERRTHRERNARMILVSLLRSARVDLAAAPEGFRAVDATDAEPRGDEMTFVSSLGFPLSGFPRREPLRVRLRLERRGGVPTFTVALEALGPGAERTDTLALFPAEHADFSYRAAAGDDWRSTWAMPARVPAAVRIRFEGDA